ncbi:hypothetical protein DMN91_000634 [Ooceraea biroi]|uniref:RIIa domain-containing protein n=1 Tax=Ooceraea biroi TaxID=2015173 RepID=A0A3L8E2D0_OOCBI|nr:hypothetical protein DMN91_000634 [Ooceraea biroi]
MNALLQKHQARHVYRVPEGLSELCSDIAREVLRSQPRNIYCFVADYVEALLMTRENAKVAVRVVNNILLGSQAIVGILHRSGLSLEQIICAAPRIQKAFRAYLDAVDTRAVQVCEDATCDEKCKVSLQSILQASGVSLEQAEKAATIIQAAFRGHYERMLLNESQGLVQWQRAATRTLEILRKAGATQAKASRAAILIQATYRGYYTRRNLKMKMMQAATAYSPEQKKDEVDVIEPEEKKDEVDMIEPEEIVQAVAWLDTIYEDSGLTLPRAHEAASIIQKAYKQYHQKKSDNVPREESTKSMVAGALIKDLHERIFDEVMRWEEIPTEFGNREDLTKTAEELRRAFNDRLTRARMAQEEYEEEDEEEGAVRLEDPNESRPINDATYLDNVTKDQEEGRGIEVEPGRDEGTTAYVRD